MELKVFMREQFNKYKAKINEIIAFEIKEAISKANDHEFSYDCLVVWLENRFDIKRGD